MPFQRLPNWFQIGAFLLAINAGMINVLGLITLLHQSVSHMTGNVSKRWSHMFEQLKAYL